MDSFAALALSSENYVGDNGKSVLRIQSIRSLFNWTLIVGQILYQGLLAYLFINKATHIQDGK
jgi:hypothetical protein